MNLSKINKIMNLTVLLLIIYVIFTAVKQQTKINSYKSDISYYNSQIEELNSEKEELLATEENVNSEEYIEEMAREKLDMYYPNETVFIDSSK